MDSETLKICHECVGEEVLKAHIQKNGKRGKCTYCGKSRKVEGLQWLAESIHQAIERHFYITPDEPSAIEYSLLRDKESTYEWDRSGEPVDLIIQEIAEIEESIADDVQEYLNSEYDLDTMDYQEEDPYGDEVRYEERGPDDTRFQESWNYFRKELITRSKFFSLTSQEILEELFSDISILKTFDGDSVVRVFGPESKDRFIYRARAAQSNPAMEQILKDPVNELGAPNSMVARSGRMNTAGISVFYGATHPETCIAEIRPPVGSHIILGRFEIIRDIRMIDFDPLSNVYVKGSYFDPKFSTQLERAAFLKRLIGELTKPIMPDDEAFEYLPTQVLAEFLSEKTDPRIDGVIFHSSQIGIGKNIVFFNHSSKTEPYNMPPGMAVSIDFGWATEDDCDDSITISEEYSKKSANPSERKEVKKHSGSFMTDAYLDFDEAELYYGNSDARSATLRLDVSSIEVKVIKEVDFKTENRNVLRHRFEKDKV